MKRIPAWMLCVLGPVLATPQLLAQTGSISASPNPCAISAGQSTCTSTISWTEENTTRVKVFVSHNGATATDFATASAGGSQSASWIQGPPHTYTFYLYDYSSGSRGNLLDSVGVSGKRKPSISSFSASPATIDSGGRSTLSWSTANATSLSISPGIGTVTGTSRSVSPTSTTTYTLTASNSVGSVTATAAVTVRPPPPSGTISASPNPCTIAAGRSTCTTTLTWNATGTSGLLVRVSHNGRASTVVSSSGARGSTSPSWIQAAPAHTYTFYLYDYEGRVQGNLLDSVTVTGWKAPAISSFSASPATINSGGSSTLSWTTANATSLSISPGIGTVTGTSHSVSPTSTTTYTLTASNSVGSVTATATITVGGTPTISSFTANPSSIYTGQSSRLRWTVTGATSISIDQDIGTVSADSSHVVSPTSTTTYTLTASNSGGSVTAAATVTVTDWPSPTIDSLTASPSTIYRGKSSTLRWTTTAAQTLSFDQGIGTLTEVERRIYAVRGMNVSPTETTTYTLTATNPTDSVTKTVTVTVNDPPPAPTISSFSASPATINSGGSSTLSWSTTNATSVSIDQGIGTMTGTSHSVSPTSTTTYTLTASNSVESVTATATVTVGRPGSASGTISASPNPCAISAGQNNCTSTITWTEENTTRVKVFVSHNGATATEFATASAGGSQSATWIQGPPHTYTFYLYDYSSGSRGDLLDSVSVSGKRVPTISSFSASPTTIDSGGSSTLSWTTANATSLSISPGIGTVTGTSRSVSPSSNTTYTLTASNSVESVTATATVTVRRPGSASGTISASPNPCIIYHGQTTCTPTVSWQSQGASSVQVWYSVNNGGEQRLASSSSEGTHSMQSIPIQATDTVIFKLYDYSGGTADTRVELWRLSVTAETSVRCPAPSS